MLVIAVVALGQSHRHAGDAQWMQVTIGGGPDLILVWMSILTWGAMG